MVESGLRPILQIRYSPWKLLRPLLLVQIIGAAWVWCVYAAFTGVFEPSQYPQMVVGLAGGLFTYSILVGPTLWLMLRSDYLTVFANGKVAHRGWVRLKYLQVSPDVRWEVAGEEIRLIDPANGEAIRSFPLPPLIRRDFRQTRS